MYGHHIGLQRRVEIVLEKYENLKEQKVGAVGSCLLAFAMWKPEYVCWSSLTNSHLQAFGIANFFWKM